MSMSGARYTKSVLAGIWLILAVTVWILPGLAAEFKMGVLDPQEVIEKSKAGKRDLDKLKEYVRTRQKVLSSDEEELKSIGKQLKEQESSLTETQRREKQEQFNVKVQAFQRRAQEFNQDLSVKNKELMDDYMKKIVVVTRQVADKGGFGLVVDKGNEQIGLRIVIYNKDTIDLTDQVIKEFDRQYK
jgi:outer membrane protein